MVYYSAASLPGSTTTTQSISVEPLHRLELRKVMALAERELLKEHPRLKDWFKEHNDEFCGARPIWIAKDGEQIVGFLMARLTKERDAKCSMLFVLDGYRESDTASDLLQTFESDALNHGKNKIHLFVYADDAAGIRFFEGCGYTKRAENYHRTEFPERMRYLMARELSAKAQAPEPKSISPIVESELRLLIRKIIPPLRAVLEKIEGNKP